MNVPFTRNAVFDGAVVKANGPASRDIRHFVRNQDTGLLEDRSQDIRNLVMSQVVRDRHEYVYNLIADREARGIPVTKGGQHDGIWEAIKTAPHDDMNAANLKTVGESTIKKAVTALQNDNRIDQFKRTRSGPRKWLGVVGGTLNQEEDMLD